MGRPMTTVFVSFDGQIHPDSDPEFALVDTGSSETVIPFESRRTGRC